jgi:hypothetical protein
MRTIFFSTPQSSIPFQRVIPEISVDIPITDLTKSSASSQQKAIQTAALKEVTTPFNLEIGPLFRFSILVLREEEFILIGSIHHIITDGISMSVLLKETHELYTTGSLPPLQIQYPDFSIWQREQAQTPEFQAHLDYWRIQLKDVPPLQLPTDYVRPPILTNRGQQFSFPFPSELPSKIQQFSKEEKVTSFITLISAFYALLYRYTNQEDICVGTAVGSRSQKELEPLIGKKILFLSIIVNFRILCE